VRIQPDERLVHKQQGKRPAQGDRYSGLLAQAAAELARQLVTPLREVQALGPDTFTLWSF